LPSATRRIFEINVGVFLALFILGAFSRQLFENALLFLAEIPQYSIPRFQIWRFLTYMFVHVQAFHILFNMLVLWFFAREVELRWSRRRFWHFYLLTGIFAGVLHAAIALATGRELGPMIGASGALMGVLLAFGAYYPNRQVLFWGIFPMPMKVLVALIIAMDVLLVGAPGDRVSRLTHLSGLVVAYAYLWRYHRTPDIRRWRYLR
jgi:membrane associated rhomboid family serine protease